MMEITILAAVSALLGLGCLGGAAWAVFGGQDVGVERIFLVLTWLMFAALFLGMAAWIARQGPLRKPEKDASSEKTQDAQPASKVAS